MPSNQIPGVTGAGVGVPGASNSSFAGSTAGANSPTLQSLESSGSAVPSVSPGTLITLADGRPAYATSSGYVPLALPALPPQGYRTALIGDSYFGLGFGFNPLATTTGTVVVSKGIMTLTYTPGATPLVAGNQVFLVNRGDLTFSASLNGANVTILTTPSNTTFTVSANFNGAVMPDGDYSSINGSPWSYYFLATTTDSSHFTFHNAFNNGMFMVTNLSAPVGMTSQDIVTILPKILAGPQFDIAWINIGANDLGGGASATLSQSVLTAQSVLNNTITVVSTLTGQGKLVILCVPAPVGTGLGGGSLQNRNIGFAQLRQGLLKYAQGNPLVRIVDVFRDCVNGTAANGDFATSMGFTDGIHLSSFGCYNIAKYENIQSTFIPIQKSIDLSALSVIEDQLTTVQGFPLWAANTVYTNTTYSPSAQKLSTIVQNGNNLYLLLNPGTSAPSGGPTGTAAQIIDGTATWAYQGAVQFNSVQNGMMSGAVAVATTGWSGTRPTAWATNNSTGVPTITSAGGAARPAVNSLGSQLIASAANSNQANLGFAWTQSITFAAAGDIVTGSTSDLTAALSLTGTSGASTFARGGWYRYGASIAVTGAVGAGAVANLRMYFQIFGGTVTFQVLTNMVGNNTTTLPLVNGDQFQIVSQPFFIPPNFPLSGSCALFFAWQGAAAGALPLAFSNAWMRAIENPFVPTTFGV